MMKICKVNDTDSILNDELRTRAKKATSKRTSEYLAICKDVEAALLVYENWSEKKLGFIYEIYVLPSFRQNGIGVQLLLFAKTKAVELGCTKIQLDAHPLDRSIEREWLYSWYREYGYVKEKKDSERITLYIKN